MTTGLSLSLEEIAKLVEGKLVGNSEHKIYNVADLESATAEDISFLSNARYEQAMLRSKAGAILMASNAPLLPEGRNLLLVEDPSKAFQILINHFFNKENALSGFTGIHPTAVIHPSAQIGLDVIIAPFAVIDQNVQIKARSYIGPFVSIGPSSIIGEDCYIHAHVTIREQSQLGARVVLQPGCVIGSCGYGYLTDKQGKHNKLLQVGYVAIENDVEIGANTTIDRSRFKKTLVKQGSKIDNLVQIGHGVTIGEHNLVVAQVGIAGSSETENYVVIGGQAGVAGHIKIGKGAQIAARSAISKSLKGNASYGGHPAEPFKEYQRRSVYLRRIEEYAKRVASLEKELQEIKSLVGKLTT